MAKQTIIIESAKELSLRGGMLVITDKNNGDEILRPLEDIQTIMIDHHSARITIPLITKLAKNNASIIFCDETHMPVTMTMDLNSNVLQSRRFQHQLSASLPLKKQIWKQIVDRAMSGVVYLTDVLQLVIHSLDDSSLPEKDLVIQTHQRVLHVLPDLCHQVYVVHEQFLKKALANVASVCEQLTEELLCELLVLQRFPVVHVAWCEQPLYDLTSVVDD